jgi:hypothetical protein
VEPGAEAALTARGAARSFARDAEVRDKASHLHDARGRTAAPAASGAALAGLATVAAQPGCETLANVKKLPVTPPTIAGSAQAASCEADPLSYGKFKRCVSVEVCDGVDNDNNGAVDDTFPGKGQPCDSGQFGRCQAGTWICKNAGTAAAVKFCQPNLGPVAEVCNGIDDDCNGAADDKIAQIGQPCTVTDPTACGGKACLGACRTGTYGCDAAHGTPFCTPSAPKAEDCVNGNDLNCNGIVYDAPAGVACGGSFANFLPDQDNDGYPQANSQAQCLCVDTSRRPGGNSPVNIPWSKYRIAQNAGKRADYCDICQDGSTAGAATVFPRAQPEDANAYWSVSANCCGNWDWDSDGASTQRFTSVGSDTCHWTNFSCPGISTTGWVQNSIPGCGQQAPYIGGGCHYVSGSGCYPDQTTGTQQCR